MEKVKKQVDKDPMDIVLLFLKALNNEDFDSAREYLNDDMKFEGVLGSRDGGEVYITDMRHMKFKYEIKKAFQDGDDVCILFDITMSGLTIFSCGWYRIRDNKIGSIRVLFDPRPILEQQAKK